MTVADIGHTESTTFTTVTPFTFSVAQGTDGQGIALAIYHGGVSTDLITGAVTWGGLALTRVATATDTVTEPGRVYVYFRGDLIGKTSDTVSITHTGSVDVKIAAASVLRGGLTPGNNIIPGNKLFVGAVGTVNNDVANPSVVLAGRPPFAPEYNVRPGAATSGHITLGGHDLNQLCFCVLYTGTAGPVAPGAAPTATVLSGMTALSENDFGAFAGGVARQTDSAPGAFTIGYTAASDDVAFAAISIVEEGLRGRYDDFQYPTPEHDLFYELDPAPISVVSWIA